MDNRCLKNSSLTSRVINPTDPRIRYSLLILFNEQILLFTDIEVININLTNTLGLICSFI